MNCPCDPDCVCTCGASEKICVCEVIPATCRKCMDLRVRQINTIGTTSENEDHTKGQSSQAASGSTPPVSQSVRDKLVEMLKRKPPVRTKSNSEILAEILNSAKLLKNPKKKGETPKKEGETPKKEGETPKKEGETPKKEGETPKKEGETPKKEGETPKKEGESKVSSSREKKDASVGNPISTEKECKAGNISVKETRMQQKDSKEKDSEQSGQSEVSSSTEDLAKDDPKLKEKIKAGNTSKKEAQMQKKQTPEKKDETQSSGQSSVSSQVGSSLAEQNPMLRKMLNTRSPERSPSKRRPQMPENLTVSPQAGGAGISGNISKKGTPKKRKGTPKEKCTPKKKKDSEEDSDDSIER